MADIVAKIEKPSPTEPLLELVKQLLKEKQFDGIALLFDEERNARNLRLLPAISEDVVAVCLEYLTDTTFEDDPDLYKCAEDTLVLMSKHGPPSDLVLIFIEVIETTKSENVFTTLLKALQPLALRLDSPNSLQWCLMSIIQHIENLPKLEHLTEGYDEKQKALLELDKDVRSVLIRYITIGFFCEPLLQRITEEPPCEPNHFYYCGSNLRNAVCSFLVTLLDKPLALLDLASHESKTNTYTLQVARTFTTAVTQCIVNPMFLMQFVVQRLRFQKEYSDSPAPLPVRSKNLFLNKDRIPLLGVAIYYYEIFVEGLCKYQVPKVYAPLYIFESGLYLVKELLSQEEPPLQHHGMELAKSLIRQLHKAIVPMDSAELFIHRQFCAVLCRIVGYSPHAQLRQSGLAVLREYLMCFDNEAKYLILKNLMQCCNHSGLFGYFVIFYKNMVAEALSQNPAELAEPFAGHPFRTLLTQTICVLPNGVTTDLLDYLDHIVSVLNMLRYLAMKDTHNLTGFWDLTKEIDEQFIKPLKSALDLSMAHFKAEQARIEKNSTNDASAINILDVDVANQKAGENKTMSLKMSHDEKVKVLSQNLCSFELIRSLLSRTMELLEKPPQLKGKEEN